MRAKIAGANGPLAVVLEGPEDGISTSVDEQAAVTVANVIVRSCAFVQLTYTSVRWMWRPQRRGKGTERRGCPRVIARSNDGRRLHGVETTECVPASGGLSLDLSFLRDIGEERPEERVRWCVRGRRSSTLDIASCAPGRGHRSRRRAARSDLSVFHRSAPRIVHEHILPTRACSC